MNEHLLTDAQVLYNGSGANEHIVNIKRLCNSYSLHLENPVQESCNYLNFVATGDPIHLLGLRNAVETIPVSNAECERGFSRMKLIITDLRTTLLVRNTSSLLFIAVNGPPEDKFDAQKYARSWL